MNNLVQISNISIHQTKNGLFSLKDLHRASGGEDRHAPRRWLQNTQTNDLIKELEKDGKPSIQSKQGLGTFVCRELVIAYGMWISPKFALQVIKTFLAVSDGIKTVIPKPTHDLLDDLTVLKLTAEKTSAEAEAAHLKYELAKLKQSLPQPEVVMPSEDLPSAAQAEMSPQKAFVLEQPEGNVFVMDVLDYPVRFVRLDGLVWICLKDLCNACGMRWEAQRYSLDIGRRISLYRSRNAIFATSDEAFDYLNLRNSNRVRHPEKLSGTRTFVQGLI